ncbi:chemotaxis protein CheW [Catenovulum agarivorans DS-2]|uniref:Chemotaxis protein CheW n=1 Tax=Catenovulum agarivorans DS-2 TaxID=1328313 RepID=W7QTP3_9ALTE|nr:chemotaxis protein CheW [Catenovulum agarivorans]EWH11218.1 chemotaxis protein CheW [Catenovulum agarivorans DS-2]
MNKWVAFLINDTRYCCNIQQIKEVIPYSACNPFPGSNEYAEGILNIRGEIITIISGEKLLCDKNITQQNNILIIENDRQERIGLTVDKVDRIVEFDPAEIDTGVDTTSPNTTWVIGTINDANDLTVVVDFADLAAQQSSEVE